MLSGAQDAYGPSMEAAFRVARDAHGMIERDDGFIEAEGTYGFLAPFRAWMAHERRAMRRARGRVLDVGCGAGRVALHLSERARGRRDRRVGGCLPHLARARCPGRARARGRGDPRCRWSVRHGRDVREQPRSAPRREARSLAPEATRHGHSPDARILGGNLDVYRTDEPVHLAYQERNRRRGRMPGQIRMRIRYREKATPWFDYLFLSIAELETIAAEGGWHIADAVWDRDGPMYVAVLEEA